MPVSICKADSFWQLQHTVHNACSLAVALSMEACTHRYERSTRRNFTVVHSSCLGTEQSLDAETAQVFGVDYNLCHALNGIA